MKREIKFRAWDTLQKEMYSWEEIGEVNSNNSLSLWNLINGLIDDGRSKIIPMQFTGLKDKNGREIYEGDVVVTTGAESEPIQVGWSYVHAGFSLHKKGWLHTHYFGEAMDGEQCEVIGNIYENPELING